MEKYSLSEVDNLIAKLKRKKRIATQNSENITNETKTSSLGTSMISTEKRNVNLEKIDLKKQILINENQNSIKTKITGSSVSNNAANELDDLFNLDNKKVNSNSDNNNKIMNNFKDSNIITNNELNDLFNIKDKNINNNNLHNKIKNNKKINFKNINNKDINNTNYNININNINNNVKIDYNNKEIKNKVSISDDQQQNKKENNDKNITNQMNKHKEKNTNIIKKFKIFDFYQEEEKNKENSNKNIVVTSKNLEPSSLKYLYNNFSNYLQEKEDIFETIDIDFIINKIEKSEEKVIFDHNNNNIAQNNHNEIVCDENNINQINSKEYGFYAIENNKVILSSPFSQNIEIYNIHQYLDSSNESQLITNYFPVSYGSEIFYEKYNNLLSIILSDTFSLTNEPILHITTLLIKFIFDNKIQINTINILQNSTIISKIISILSEVFQRNEKFNSQNEPLINKDKLKSEISENNNYFCDLLNDNNISSNIFLDYILNLFDNCIFNKNNFVNFYFKLLNLNYDCDEIFINFDIYLYILLKYIKKYEDINKIIRILIESCSKHMTFLHYVILKILIGEYEINNEKFYGKIFTEFLEHISTKKLIIADFYNLILFTVNSQVKEIFAKSSILIKYKYILLKKSYEIVDENDNILSQKIFENLDNFGKISNNSYFRRYLKEEICENVDNTSNEIKEEVNSNENDNKNKEGIFSSIRNVFGLRGDNLGEYENNNKNKENSDNNSIEIGL